jgi:hypothetical protein
MRNKRSGAGPILGLGFCAGAVAESEKVDCVRFMPPVTAAHFRVSP